MLTILLRVYSVHECLLHLVEIAIGVGRATRTATTARRRMDSLSLDVAAGHGLFFGVLLSES